MRDVAFRRGADVGQDGVEVGGRRQRVVEGDDGEAGAGEGFDVGFGQVLPFAVEQAAAVEIQDGRPDRLFRIQVDRGFFGVVGVVKIDDALHGAHSFRF